MKEVINENNCKKDKEILIYDKVGLIDNEVEYFDSQVYLFCKLLFVDSVY